MKKSIIVYVLCSCLVMVHVTATPCPNITIPGDCQDCTNTKKRKDTCEVTCKACHCTDGTIGPADTKIQFERDGSEDIEITVDENGELEIAE